MTTRPLSGKQTGWGRKMKGNDDKTPETGDKRSIRVKTTKMMLKVSMLAVVLCAASAFGGMVKMKGDVEKESRRLGELSAADSEAALTEQAENNLRAQVEERAALTSEKLKKIGEQVEVTAGYLTAIYSSPGSYTPYPVEKPSLSNKGIWALQYSLVEGVAYSQVQEEINMAGAVYPLVSALCDGNETISSIYYSAESGFMVSYDKNSDNMFEGKAEGEPAELFLDHYDPRGREWYQEAINTGEVVFTETYLDAFGRLLISCAAPVYQENGHRPGEPAGVLAMDILIEDINNEIVSARIGDDGYVFLMNREGKIVTSPNLEMKNDRFETENLFEDPELSELAGHMAAGENGILLIGQENREALAAYAPVELAGWSMAMVLPRDEVIAPAVESHQNILMHTASTIGKIHGTIRAMSMIFLAVIAAILLLVFLVSDFFARKITDPIRQMIRDVWIIGQGKLDYRVEVHTNDELETLSDTFNQMTSSLNRYMNNLAEVRADRERIATELSVATTIQASMLPCIFPAFPERKEFDIFADMHPAKEVGGDFYDFFMTDEDHLWVVMADVSGKGVPAALFMVITKTMLKNYAAYHPSPAEVLTVVNDRLCESNEAGMFVTAFVGVLQISTGKFTFSNAGHNYPLLRRRGEAFDWLKSETSFVLAGMESMEYQDFTEKLGVGDCLFLYTDGVTEALNEEDALYGDDRLKDTLNVPGTAEISLEGLIDYVKDDIKSFAGQAAQADDITMLALMLKERGDEKTEL